MADIKQEIKQEIRQGGAERWQRRGWCLAGLLLIVGTLLSVAACAPTRVLNLIAAAGSGYQVNESVVYGLENRQQLDIYTPSGTAPAGGWPMVVFFYGGSWNSGARQDYRFVGAALASWGVLTLVADYRLYPEVRYPSFLQDSARALAYGLDNAARLGANPARVFVMGHSAGAYNAAMLALDARWLQATGHAPAQLAGWIGLAGAYNFFPMTDPQAQPVFFHPNYPANALPVDVVQGPAPRTLLAVATQDDVVDPLRNTGSLANKLRSLGVDVTQKHYDGASHATLIGAFAAPLRGIAPVLDDVLGFVDVAEASR